MFSLRFPPMPSVSLASHQQRPEIPTQVNTRPFVGAIGLVREAYFPEGNPGTCPISALYRQVAHPDPAAVRSDGGADRWAAASVGIAQAAAAPKKTIPISPRNGEVSEKAGSGSRDDGLSGPGEDRSEPPERRTVLEGLSWRPIGIFSRVGRAKTNSCYIWRSTIA